MYVTLVDVWLKPESVEAFKVACEANHLASVQESGNCRFDILQQADAQAHKLTAHYLAWRDRVADMMAQPRQGKVYQGLWPAMD